MCTGSGDSNFQLRKNSYAGYQVGIVEDITMALYGTIEKLEEKNVVQAEIPTSLQNVERWMDTSNLQFSVKLPVLYSTYSIQDKYL